LARYYLPTELVTGPGALDQIGSGAARFGKRALLVSGGGSARRSGILDRASSLLSVAGIEVTLFDRVAHEPDLTMIESGISLARSAGCDLVVGLGGGSVLDTAKAVAGLATLPGSVADYHAGRTIESSGLPFLAIPTTAGTGAEVTRNAVLIDPETRVKKSIRDDRWFARVAIVDPQVMVSMPPNVTASTGSDALCQAIEAFTSIAASAVTDALAMQAIERVGKGLSRAYHQGSDLEAREDMAYASLMAGIAMANARLGGVHGMAHPLGSHYHIPHGVVCGLLLPYTMAYNLSYAEDKYARVGRLLGDKRPHETTAEAAAAAVTLVRDLLAEIGIPAHLRQYGVKRENLSTIVEESLPSGSLKHNPRPLGAEDVRKILEAAL